MMLEGLHNMLTYQVPFMLSSISDFKTLWLMFTCSHRRFESRLRQLFFFSSEKEEELSFVWCLTLPCLNNWTYTYSICDVECQLLCTYTCMFICHTIYMYMYMYSNAFTTDILSCHTGVVFMSCFLVHHMLHLSMQHACFLLTCDICLSVPCSTCTYA